MPRALQQLHLRFALATALGLAWAGILSTTMAPANSGSSDLACPATATAATVVTVAETAPRANPSSLSL